MDKTIWGGLATNIGIEGMYIHQTLDSGFVIAGYSYNVVAGYSHYDGILIKLNHNGNIEWTKNYRNPIAFADNSFYHAQQTNDGGYVMIGSTEVSGANSIYLIRTNSLGDTLWTKTYCSSFWGNFLEQNGGKYIKETTDGGFIINYTGQNSGSYSKACILKIDSIGNVIWAKAYGVSCECSPNSICQMSDGGYIISGIYYDTLATSHEHPFLIRINSIGDTLWTKTYGATNLDISGYHNIYSSLATTDGGFILGCHVITTAHPDIYIIKTDSSGNSGCIERNLSMSVSSPNIVTGYVTTQVLSSGISISSSIVTVGSEGGAKADCMNIGIEELSENNNKILISPNPFTSQTTISFSEAQTNTILKIRDVLGNIVNSQKATGKSITLDMSGVAKGIYFVEITDGSASSPNGRNIFYKKIVLQ